MKIVVIDDDPTGSQTVHNCPLLFRWDKDVLVNAYRNKSPLLFLLANTRSMPPALAEGQIRTICYSLRKLFFAERVSLNDVFLISRGDSTLRGHGVLEPKIIEEELGPFDATFHVPAFLEGGRTTVEGVHFLHGEPVHQSDFAKDQLFGYSTSHIPLWLEEKSNGSIKASSVFSVNILSLESALNSQAGMNNLLNNLSRLSGNRSVVVDAKNSSHLEVFVRAVKMLQGSKRFLFRSAASLLTAFADLPVNSYDLSDLISLRCIDQFNKLKPGLVMVGSHVSLADAQLTRLLDEDECEGIELSVRELAGVLNDDCSRLNLSDFEMHYFQKLNKVLDSSRTPVLYTSRGELVFSSIQERLNFGISLANSMGRLAAKMAPKLGYIISKGGITTQALLENGLKLSSVQLKGQLMPGLSIVSAVLGEANLEFPVVTFPGNLGDRTTLFDAWELMESDGKP